MGVSKGSVSNWVRNIELTEGQLEKIRMKNPIYNNQLRGSNNNKEKFKLIRKEYQEKGAKIICKQDVDFIVGCMLYWAEGAKDRNSFKFTNSDASMIKICVSFLFKFFSEYMDIVYLDVSCYSNAGLNNVDIEQYWRNITKLSNNKITIRMDSDKRINSGKKIKYPYGICNVRLNKTEVVQQIFGAIKEYAQIEDEERWI